MTIVHDSISVDMLCGDFIHTATEFDNMNHAARERERVPDESKDVIVERESLPAIGCVRKAHINLLPLQFCS